MLSYLVVAQIDATGAPTIFTFWSAASIVAPFRPAAKVIFYS